jgi:xanthine dehydrogenase molybdenum-binding subunit
MNNERAVFGKPVALIDGIEKVTGSSRYYGDVILPGMLHCKLLRSPYASAEILSIDTSKAKALPGVELILTYENCPVAFWKDLHYVGDLVAAVVARDEAIAEEACDLIEVKYDPRPFVLDIVEAMKPDAPRVFPDRPNILPGWAGGQRWFYYSERDPVTGLFTKRELSDFQGFGDVGKGFAEADVIVSDDDINYAYTRVHVMEPRGCVAWYKNKKLTVWSHSQGLHTDKKKICLAFDLPSNAVNFVSPCTGGSFGGKNGNFQKGGAWGGTAVGLIPIAATLELGKPVRLVLTREEEMLCGWSRGCWSKAKLGFKKDGSLTTMDIEHWCEVGPDRGSSPIGTCYRYSGCMLYARNCKHVRIRAGAVFTNRYEAIGWQGYGTPESAFLTETLMDEAAYILGIDAVELRRKNHFQKGDPLVESPFFPDVPPDAQIASCGIDECLDKGSEAINWKKWKHPKDKTGIKKEGLGMGLTIHGAGPLAGGFSAGEVRVSQDGQVIFICATADFGQGQHTAQSQIVAEVLGVPFENVRIVCHDTDTTPWSSLLTGSSGTFQHGWASYMAAMDAKKQILELAARKLKVSPEELDIKNARVFVKINPDKQLTLAEAIMGKGREMVIGSACTTPPDYHYIPKEQGAQFADIEVDSETGKIKVLNHFCIQYVGKATNPKIVAGQLQQTSGVEAALWCECISDPQTGKLLTYNFENYPVATIHCRLQPIIVESISPDPSHPFGAVACGEGVANPTTAVFGNAIYNALGIRLKSTPFTPDKILKALKKI